MARQVEAAHPEWAVPVSAVAGMLNLAVLGLLLAGGILLFRRSGPGRWLVVAPPVAAWYPAAPGYYPPPRT